MQEEKLKSNIAEREEKILEFWQNNKIFEKSLEKEASNGLPAQESEFVFFDGPPFATGLPHYGHILPGTIKDIIPRYQTMKGKKVRRKWGWDCHGLPVENIVEKELGFKSKLDIEKYGIDKFNLAARNVVFRYADQWKKIIPRTGRWVDMEDDYRTIDTSYTESVWWAFKKLYDKGLVTTGFKSMHLCPKDETTLSNFEVNQGYKDITDLSVTVEFELVEEPNTFVLAWTTTPWTLPGNVALAINPDIEYVAVEGEVAGKIYILAQSRLEAVFKGKHKIIKTLKGSELIGKKYKPLFNYYADKKLENKENGWKIYPASFVTTEDGTGVVHIAPAFGEDDLNLGKEKELPFIQHVNTDGTFKDEITDFAGQKVKPIDDVQKADVEIIKYMAKRGAIFAKEKFVHSYPHCWRCGTPLLNYATSSWFIKVTDIKDRLVELNKTITWNPEDIGEGRFGKWLEGARDWAISRTRYWGAPLPVWETSSGERVVVGSLAELKDRIGRRNNFYLMRHGQSEANAKGNIIHSANPETNPLTENGRAKVKTSAEEFNKKIDLIFVSPFLRAKQTAEIVAETLGLDKSKIIVDERLKEINADGYSGKTWEEFLSNFSSVKERFEKRVGGSETWSEVLKRGMEFMYDIDAKYQGKNILVIGHGGPLDTIQLGSMGMCKHDIARHYYDDGFLNAQIKKCDFVSLPHNEDFETDLHRPFIDNIILRNEKGEVLKRIPEVFDCWVESGAMSFAQNHYPFEHKDEFESKDSHIFPADFIAEGQDQTRGWFYTMLALSVGLFDRVPYKEVVVNGMVLAEDGRKMSKSLNNYPDPMDIINKYGADALRYYLVNSPAVKAGDINFSEKGVDEISKKIIQKIYNVLSFFEMYRATSDDKAVSVKTNQTNLLDEWITSRLNESIETMTSALDKYEIDRASRPIMDFVDDLSTWYIRRSRERFKSDDADTRLAVSNHTAHILGQFAKIVAPFMPFLAEEIYKKVNGKLESVHLEKWPEAEEVNTKLIEDMQKAREVVTSALELRQKAGIKVRQPLSQLKIKSHKFEKELLEIIADEVNVKNVVQDNSIEASVWLDTELTKELKEEGLARDIIRAIQDVRKKENLSPSDSVKLIVSAGPEIVSIFGQYADMIENPTGISSVEFSKESQTYRVTLGEEEISLTIIK